MWIDEKEYWKNHESLKVAIKGRPHLPVIIEFNEFELAFIRIGAELLGKTPKAAKEASNIYVSHFRVPNEMSIKNLWVMRQFDKCKDFKTALKDWDSELILYTSEPLIVKSTLVENWEWFLGEGKLKLRKIYSDTKDQIVCTDLSESKRKLTQCALAQMGVKQFRELLGLPPNQFADLCNVHEKTYGNHERTNYDTIFYGTVALINLKGVSKVVRCTALINHFKNHDLVV